MGVTSPNPGHHAVINGSNGNNSIVQRLDHSIGIETRSGSERTLCQCCPYGYHIDVDFVRFCEALAGGEGWGDTGKRIRRSRRRQRQSMEGLLGLTGPSVWLMEHHLPKIPQEWPTATVAADPVGASAMVRDALQQAVNDFEDTLKRSSHKGVVNDRTNVIPCGDIPHLHQKDASVITHSSQAHVVSTTSQLPVVRNAAPRRERDSASSTSSLVSTTSSITNHPPASAGCLRVSTSITPTQELIHDTCTKVLTTCTSDTSQQGHNLSYPQHDSDGGSVGSNASGGLSTEALQNIREQMAISLEKMKEMEEKLKLIPILQVQLSILKEEKRKMILQLKQKQSGITFHEVKSLTNDSTQTTQTDLFKEKRDAGVCCSVLTREVGTCHQPPRLRDVSTSTIIPQEISKSLRKSLVFSPVKTESIPSECPKITTHAFAMTELCGKTWNFDSEYPEGKQGDSKCHEKSPRGLKEASTTTNGMLEPNLDDFGTKSFLKSLESPPMKPLIIIEKRDSASQTIVEENKSDKLPKKELIKRDVQVQANLQRSFSISREVQTSRAKLSHIQTQTQGRVTRDMAILAKPAVREAILSVKPAYKDFSSSCNLSSEKDSMSVSLQALGVKSTEEMNGSISLSKSTDTMGLVLSSDAAVNVHISEPLVSREIVQEKSLDKLLDITVTRDLVSRGIEKEREVSASRNEQAIAESKSIDESQSPRRKAPFLRQNTYTECKAEVNSLSSEKKFSEENERLSSQNLTDSSKCVIEISRQVSQNSDNETYGETSFESIVTEDDSLQQYMTSEKSHYQLFTRTTNRKTANPSKEMKAAIKVVNDLLQKQPRSNLKAQLKSATGVIQQEWFTISSTAMANPLDVEDYLDYFEDISVALLEYIVNLPDNTGNTAMHYAVSHGNFDVVSILLDSKVCDIRRPNQAGYTCVMLVSLAEVRSETDRQVVRRLFQMADVNMRAKQHGQTALMLSVSHGRLDMVQLLLEAGADVNIQDEDGSTALMCAAEHGHADIVRALLAQPDCDASIVDNDGSTALNIAMEAGHRNIGVLLYAHEHFQPASPHGSLKQWRITKHSSSQASTPTPAETSS